MYLFILALPIQPKEAENLNENFFSSIVIQCFQLEGLIEVLLLDELFSKQCGMKDGQYVCFIIKNFLAIFYYFFLLNFIIIY